MSESLVPRYSELLAAVRARTPARILVGRAGPSYRTATQLELRRDHAAALDAVHAEIEMARDLGIDLVRQFQLFEVRTRAGSKQEYLLRPDLGRRLDDASRELIRKECPTKCVIQVAIGDGLSAAAVALQVPALLLLLDEEARRRGWSFGRPFFIRHCRVGVLNHIGDILDPEVVVLLIGERPGLATAESLSAYLAYCPRPGHTDAQRNLISNIHARGVGHEEAARRIMALAEQMRQRQTSGIAIKEELAGLSHSVSAASQKRLRSAD
ncbi:MAG TPA: ethanolamine ammonia-lyase subunit EutC [Gemmataceae bacterium]|nr:ethanolamine ammonia-lyase subunit EutC [Gemmataceae bacterium]